MLEEAGFPAISHTTISNEVRRFGVLQKKQLEQMRDTLFLNGKEIKGQKKRLRILFIEADGVVVKCRRAKQKNIELKMGVVYEGWEEIAGKRKLKNPQIMVGVLDGIDFWETFTAVLSKKYDLKNTLVIINGDGAPWIL